MKIGYAKVDITPDVGVSLAGYIEDRKSEGIHSPLYAKALVLKHWRKTYLWLSLDLIAIDHVFLVRFKEELKKHHFHFEDIEVFATHTHSGPCGTCEVGAFADVFGEVDHEYIKQVAIKSVHAVKEAMMDFGKFKLSIAQSELKNFATSRHNKDILIPNTLTTILFTRDKKKEDILLYHFACHPTVLHHENKEISSDFVGCIEERLKEQYSNVMFLNGSCGNISTRFTRKESSFEELERLALVAVKQISTTLKTSKPIEINKYKAYHYTYDLKKRELESEVEAKQKLDETKAKLEAGIKEGLTPQALRLLESYYEGAQANYRLILHDDGAPSSEIHLAIIQFGDYYVVCVPAELFHSLEEKIECNHCLVINYANGYHAYIADQEAYEQEYYESMMSYYASGEGEKMIAYINQKLKELHT